MLTIFILQSVSYGATQITGTVTARKGDSVKVEFEPHKTAGPKIGDRVDFKKIMQGIEVTAGNGEVKETSSGFVWVKIQKKPVKLDMIGVIQATGSPGPTAYFLDLPGVDIKSQGQVLINPGARFDFRFAKGLHITVDEPITEIRFPSGHSLSYEFIPPRGDIMKTHRESRETMFSKYWGPDDPYEDTYEFVWKDKEIQGKNSEFIVSQVIKTTKTKNSSLPPEREQYFLITCEAPLPADKNNYTKLFWNFKLDLSDDDYNRSYWEKVILDIFQSASVTLK